MASSIYSVRIAGSYNYAGWKYVTAPAWTTLVIRSLSFTQLDGSGAIFGIDAQNAWAFYRPIQAANSTNVVDCRYTAAAGEGFGFYTSAALIAYQANGFQFTEQPHAMEKLVLTEEVPDWARDLPPVRMLGR